MKDRFKREMYHAMRELLGEGYVPEYYKQAVEPFINIAEAAIEAEVHEAKQKPSRRKSCQRQPTAM